MNTKPLKRFLDRLDEFLRRHEIDVPRCLTAMLLLYVVKGVYDLILFPFLLPNIHLNFSLDQFLRIVGWWHFSLVVLGFLGFLGVALWNYRTWALWVTIALICLYILVLLVASISGTFLWSIGPSIGFVGYYPDERSWYLILRPLLAIPIFVVVLLALLSPQTRNRFRRN